MKAQHDAFAALILPRSQNWEDGRRPFSAVFREFGSLWELGREKFKTHGRARTRVYTHAHARADFTGYSSHAPRWYSIY